jgi:hypothetical protein
MTDLTSTIDVYLEAYGEPDATRRAELVRKVWATEGELIDPPLDAAGHAAISDMAAAVQGQFPGHTFRRTSAVDQHHDFARYEWELVGPDGSPAVTGLDVAQVGPDGLIRRVVGFLGPVPAREA